MRELKTINQTGFKEGEWSRAFDLFAEPELKTRPRKIVKQGITKEQFLDNLGKVCQPIKSDSEKSET